VDPPASDRLLQTTSVLLDLDGVLYVEDEPIAGAIEAVAALRIAGCGCGSSRTPPRALGVTSSPVSSGSGCPSRNVS
jgi:hypothetical protein